MFPTKAVLEIYTEIQIHELQSAVCQDDLPCLLYFLEEHKIILVHKWLLFLQNKSIFVLFSGFNFKGVTPHASQSTKYY